jgi:imidazolonepropionase-like amidohydrolase
MRITDVPLAATVVEEPSDVIHILAGKTFDSYTLQFVERQHIKVSKTSGLITDVTTFGDDLDGLDVRSLHVHDLRELTVLPGFVDVHVHCETSPRARGYMILTTI